MSTFRMDYSDIKKFEKLLRVGGPKTAVSIAKKSARKGAKAVKEEVVRRAPVGETKQLRRHFETKMERSRLKGKVVLGIKPSRNYNHIFQKPIKNRGMYGGKSASAYYPSSVEYGFLTRAKGGQLKFFNMPVKGNNKYRKRYNRVERYESRKTEGYPFMLEAAEHAEAKMLGITLEEYRKQIDSWFLEK